MNRFLSALIIIIAASLTCGCSKEDPHPEVRDPIYKDLKSQADLHQKEVEEQKKFLGEFKVEMAKTEANSMERKDFRIKIAKAESNIKNHEQWAHFYRIRTERRAVVDKVTSKEARLADKPWPDPSEYSDYLVNKRLREVSLNWNSRVPRLQDRLPKKVMVEKDGEAENAAPERKPASGH